MLKFAGPICLVLAVAGSLSPARAGDTWDEFWYGVHVGWHRNNEWPQPFSAADRNYAVAPFAVMVAGGWQRQNLIGENYFDDNSTRLNSAGVERVRFILRQGPVEHRVFYVQSDLDENITRMRIDAVQETIVSLQPKGPMPEVIVSNMVPEGRSAEMVAAEFKNFASSAPATRLMSHAASGGSGGGNGSGTSSGSGSGGGTGGGN